MPSVRSSAVTTTVTDASSPYEVAITMPGTIVAGDLLLVFITDYNFRQFNPTPSGWTKIGSDWGQGLYAKVAAGSDTVTFTLSGSTACNAVALAVQDWSGVIGDIVFGSTYNDPVAADRISPSVTVVEDSSLLLRSVQSQSPGSTPTINTPTGHTLVASHIAAANGPITRVVRGDSLVNASATGTATWTGVPSVSWSRCATVAVPPDVANPPTITSVTITGTSQIGQTLTATVVTDQGTPDSVTYQWNKASDDTGAGSATITGATADDLILTYTDFADLLDADADSVYINCTCTATKNSLTSDPESSAWQQVVVPSGAGGGAGSLIGSPLII